MQHRGTARRRVLIVHGEAPLPAPGTEIRAGGRTLGLLGSVSGDNGLAIVRIDRVKDTMDRGDAITAGDVPVNLAIPGWAKFTYPQPAAPDA
jgi:folate-binding Fe-S cluster repair protein YgfZ